MRLRDELATVSGKAAFQGAMAALDGVQHLPAAEQVASVWMLAFAMARQLGLDVSDLLNQTERRARDGDTFYQRELKAINDYCEGELR